MAIDPELLEILVCPENHQPVKLAEQSTLDELNTRIKAGGVKNHAGEPVTEPVAEGLIRDDKKCLYIVEDSIPNMLIEERIELS